MKIALFNYPLASMGGAARYTLTLAQALASRHEVTVLHEPGVQPDDVRRRLALPLYGVTFRELPLEGLAASDNPTVGAVTRLFDCFVNCSYRFPRPESKRALSVVFFPNAIDLRPAARVRWWMGQMLRPAQNALPVEMRARLRGLPSRADVSALQRFHQLISISAFAQHWVRMLWKRESQLLHPLVQRFEPGPKQNIILTAGRFFRHNTASKRHAVMIEAFRDMVRQGLEGWELHCVGGLNPGLPGSEAYLREIEQQAAGLPVRLHVNAPYAKLADLYGRASIYWHAMGHNADLANHPDRAEHFGITTVEAMSAGCVPVVIDAGGQPEIVTHGQSGFLWRTSSDLVRHTMALIGQPALRAGLSGAAYRAARPFCDADAFNQRALALIEQAIASPG